MGLALAGQKNERSLHRVFFFFFFFFLGGGGVAFVFKMTTVDPCIVHLNKFTESPKFVSIRIIKKQHHVI